MIPPRFRRLVLELSAGADPAAMRAAAGLARLLGVDLHGLFVEDEALLGVSLFGFAREIDAVSFQWRALDPDGLAADLRAAAARARHALTEAARAAGLVAHFEVRRGDPVSHVADLRADTDIVAVWQAGHAARDTRRVRESAYRSAASVLVLPRDGARRDGPVVAVAADADDPALRVAAGIAAAAGAATIVLSETPMALGADVRSIGGMDPLHIALALGATRERLIVLSRGRTGDIGASLAAARGTPVLVLEGGGV